MTEFQSIQWLAPAALWNEPRSAVNDPPSLQPWIAEFQSDDFFREFKVLMKDSPSDLVTHEPLIPDGNGNGPFRLYRPIDQRHYLVSASLVRWQVGFPDVVRGRDLRASFVVRRIVAGDQEEARLRPSHSWMPAASTQVTTDHDKDEQEETLGLHPVDLYGFADPDSPAGMLGLARPADGSRRPARKVYVGYLPVGQYLTPRPPGAPVLPNPVFIVKAVYQDGDDQTLLSSPSRHFQLADASQKPVPGRPPFVPPNTGLDPLTRRFRPGRSPKP